MLHRETLAVHGGYEPDPATRALAVPICQTAAHAFDSAAHAAALFNLEEPGFRYGRIANPTTAVLERRVAALEGGTAALCLASGQAALHATMLNVAVAGTNIVSVPQLYGTTYTMFAHFLPGLGIGVRLAEDDSPGAVAALIDADTRAIFCESVGNPAGNIADLDGLAAVARAHALPLIVDNTVPTPILLRPLEHGAAIVIASLTKFMGGHGTTLGGVIVDGGVFDWGVEGGRKYPNFCAPDPSYHGLIYADRFGPAAFVERARAVYLRVAGAVLPPLSAFLLLQGIDTLAVRMDRHVANAAAVAAFLRGHPAIDWVNHASLPDHPSFALAGKYLGGRACPLLTFGVRGGYAAGVACHDALRLIRRVVNLGDVKSLACHPASTTHRQMPPEQARRAGVLPETIRMSVGIEHVDDITADLDQALRRAA